MTTQILKIKKKKIRQKKMGKLTQQTKILTNSELKCWQKWTFFWNIGRKTEILTLLNQNLT